MIERRTLLKTLAALPLLAHAGLAAQGPRVAGARILLRDGRLWMQVRFGTRGPYAFIIDTGAWVNLIKRDVARELGLRELRQIMGQGIGGTQAFTLYEGRDVSLGGVGIGTADFAGYGPELGFHPEAMGALATNVLTTADSDLDFDAGEWRIYPDGRGERPGFVQLPSEIDRSATRVGSPPIILDTVIGSQTYRLKMDTGAPLQILLDSTATRRSGLWNDSVPYAPRRSSGIGGAGALNRTVRLPELRVGPIAFARPLVTLSDPGALGRTGMDGLLGLNLIQQMNLSTDVRANRLWAMRNAVPAPPERYGLTGLWAEERDGHIVLVAVSPHSPASDAGLRVGDEIHDVPLGQWIRRLGGRPGTVVDIAYRRGGTAHTTRLTLREFL